MLKKYYRFISIWWFPEIEVPLVIIHFSAILPYKPSILGDPHDYGNPHTLSCNQLPHVPFGGTTQRRSTRVAVAALSRRPRRRRTEPVGRGPDAKTARELYIVIWDKLINLLVLNAGNGWEWGNGIIINDYCGSFPHSLLSTSK